MSCLCLALVKETAKYYSCITLAALQRRTIECVTIVKLVLEGLASTPTAASCTSTQDTSTVEGRGGAAAWTMEARALTSCHSARCVGSGSGSGSGGGPELKMDHGSSQSGTCVGVPRGGCSQMLGRGRSACGPIL